MRILEQKNPRQKCVNHENAMNLVTKKAYLLTQYDTWVCVCQNLRFKQLLNKIGRQLAVLSRNTMQTVYGLNLFSVKESIQ